MKSRSVKPSLKLFSVAICAALTLCPTRPALSQAAGGALASRISAPIENGSRVAIAGSRPPRIDASVDAGPVAPSLRIQGISLVFSRTAVQQAALDALVEAQQNPASQFYHHWLLPAQFGAQFGVSNADIAAVQSWLEQQGFAVDSVSPSHTRIVFSGTAGQVASAFGTEIHNYTIPATQTHPATTHFAPSSELSVPAALASSVLSIGNLSDFRPHAHVKVRPASATAKFTTTQSEQNFLSPGDVATVYDVAAATRAGYTGAGETIVVIGQSAIETSDLSNFQTAAGIPAKLPTLILMPGTGTSTVNPGGSSDDDEVESDLDLEYSSAIAQGATIDFIYTGSNTNYGAFDALQYAVDNKATYPASIISSSYGVCEPLLGLSDYNTLNAILEQAATQGQTVVSAAGDAGSTDCNGEYASNQPASNEQVAVDYPGSSQYVTDIGGTEFVLSDIAPGSSYFNSASSANIVSSAKSYIPEQVWNDDAGYAALGDTSPISSGGGGVSIYTLIPSWQTGVPGIPTSTNRLVPDVSLYASPGEPDVSAKAAYGGYLFCSSDSASIGFTGSCADGFISPNGYLTVAGGTSFGAPIFSGMLAIINQSRGFTAASGQGNINPTLYTLASNSTTYASAFHDITSGGNQCAAGTTYCGTGAQTTDYATNTGYDEASGLGSVDLYNLLTAWPGTPTGGSSTPSFSLSATNITVADGSSGTSTITITPAGGYTGTIDWAIAVNGASSTLQYACYTIADTAVTGTSAVTTTLTIYTAQNQCTNATPAVVLGAKHSFTHSAASAASNAPASPFTPLRSVVLMSGLVFACAFGRKSALKSSKLRLLATLLLVGTLATVFTGCGSGGSGSSNNDAAPGTYSLTITGTDSAKSTITAATNFTLVIN